uniref:Putative portal protein n=1 Tax=viral metagenome TaxID=1070528 RepID=A0A6M3L4L9_9ZZZZ
MAEQLTNTLRNINAKWHLGNIPPEGHPLLGRFSKSLWDAAKREKISVLGLHERFSNLHKRWRGRKTTGNYPDIGINPIFKTIHGHVSALTEKTPIAEIRSEVKDDQSDPRVKAFDQDIQDWWVKTEQQFLLFVSVLGMSIYGTTVEKAVWNAKDNEPEIIARDAYGFFPAPEYTLCTIEKLPYCCDAFLMPIWKVRQQFEIPSEVPIPANDGTNLLGKERNIVRGGLKSDTDGFSSNYPSNYATIREDSVIHARGGIGDDSKCLVVEIWIKDGSVIEEPIIDDIIERDDQGREFLAQQQVGMRKIPVYLDGIRKITILPDMEGYDCVIDDTKNPSINWEIVGAEIENLVKKGIPVPVSDQMGNVVGVQAQPVEIEDAISMVVAKRESDFLWGRFPFSAIPAMVDTSQWWGFSIIEQIEELSFRAKGLFKRYYMALDRSMHPTFINPLGSMIPNDKITNLPRQILRPSITTANLLRFVDQPPPHRTILEFAEFLLMQIDINSLTPEVTEGRRPKGISAASALIALMEKASSQFSPMVRNVDKLTRTRGRMYISLKKNFDHEQRTVMVGKQPVSFIPSQLDIPLDYVVESGSSAPITKIGRRQQYVELFKLGALDLLSMLEMLEIPNPQRIIERLYGGLIGIEEAIKILISKGLPEEIGVQLYQELKAREEGPQLEGGRGGENTSPKQGAAPHAGASDGMRDAYKQMEIPGKNV